MFREEILFTPFFSAGDTYWGAPVPTFGSLPPSGLDGEAHVVLDTDSIYVWDATTLSWKLITGNANALHVGATAPPGTPVNGFLWSDTVNHVLYQYDSVRGKWLSTSELVVSGGRNAVNVTNVYLESIDSIPSNLGGQRIPYNATLVAMVAVNNPTVNETWVAEARRNGVVTPIASVSIVAGTFAVTTVLNFDVSTNDRIEWYCNGTNIDRPRIDLFFKRRG